MTDPRDVMLEAGRELHDRYPYDPRQCLTCRGNAGEPVEWPCATATALGATGRSEWKTPGVDEPPGSIRCASRAPDRPLIRCALEDGHAEQSGINHRDTGGNQWSDHGQWWGRDAPVQE